MTLRTPAKILIMGLPNSGKTTLARALREEIGGVHWNGDALRACPWARPLGWSVEDRWEQSRRMRWLAEETLASGVNTICDFICPRIYCRDLFKVGEPETFVIWCDRGEAKKAEYKNTYAMWEAPGLNAGDQVDFYLRGNWDVDLEVKKIGALFGQ